MQAKSTPVDAQFVSVIATAMDEGWTESDIVAAVKRMAAEESERRTQETARKLYAPAAKALNFTSSAVAIVAKAKLPRGQYAITRPNEMAPDAKGSAVRAVEAALTTGQDRFVGIVYPNGTFADERAWHEGAR